MVTCASIAVLIVDDSKIMRQIIAKRLQEMGFVALYQADGVAAALEILAVREIGLILSDWSMPGVTGIDFLKVIRGAAATRHIPFVLLTAEAQLHTILLAYQAGVSQYVTKPFTKEYFAYIIDKVVRESYEPDL
jgi:CheY-like chemotaxis protein